MCYAISNRLLNLLGWFLGWYHGHPRLDSLEFAAMKALKIK